MSDDLDFERAEFAEGAAEHVTCASCERAITTQYFQFADKILCETCKDEVQRTTDDLRAKASLSKALLFGGGTALGCGIGYAIFVGLTNIQFALVTLGIGWAIGRAIQTATSGFGSRKHQIAAVALTYFASAMGYLPALIGAVMEVAHEQGTTPIAAAASAGTKIYALALMAGFMLAAPFLELASGEVGGFIGLIIIFVGLRTAWRMSQGVTATITGPHAVGTAPST
jgi:hypothetical protein